MSQIAQYFLPCQPKTLCFWIIIYSPSISIAGLILACCGFFSPNSDPNFHSMKSMSRLALFMVSPCMIFWFFLVHRQCRIINVFVKIGTDITTLTLAGVCLLLLAEMWQRGCQLEYDDEKPMIKKSSVCAIGLLFVPLIIIVEVLRCNYKKNQLRIIIHSLALLIWIKVTRDLKSSMKNMRIEHEIALERPEKKGIVVQKKKLIKKYSCMIWAAIIIAVATHCLNIIYHCLSKTPVESSCWQKLSCWEIPNIAIQSLALLFCSYILLCFKRNYNYRHLST